jgi:hypothetical protein
MPNSQSSNGGLSQQCPSSIASRVPGRVFAAELRMPRSKCARKALERNYDRSPEWKHKRSRNIPGSQSGNDSFHAQPFRPQGQVTVSTLGYSLAVSVGVRPGVAKHTFVEEVSCAPIAGGSREKVFEFRLLSIHF